MRPCLAGCALAILLTAVVAPARAERHSFTAQIDDDVRIATCADIQMWFSNDGVRGSGIVTVHRERTVALTASAALRVRSSARGGVRVQPSSDGSYSALVCMAAAAGSEKQAEALLDQVRVVNGAGGFGVEGPENAEWAAYMVLSVPRDAALEVSAENGEVSIRDVVGHFKLRTTNGPISVTDIAGELDAEAVNGPIQFRGHAGDVRLAAQNGSLSVRLDAVEWSGKGLDASTQNGPVTLVAPPGLRTGVTVRGSRNSPFSLLTSARPMDDGPGDLRTFRLGTGEVKVRLSTVNGPVGIKTPKETRGKSGI